MARVYISSTYKDLRECRDKVYATLRRMNHDVIAMEDYVAADRRPLDKCLADVGTCELYIGIFARRYGYVPEEQNPEGRSITEMELRHAKKVRVKRLCFLLRDEAPWPPTATDHGILAERLRALRESIQRDLLVDFFSSADDLATDVAVAVNQWHLENPGRAGTIGVVGRELKLDFVAQMVQRFSTEADRGASARKDGKDLAFELVRTLHAVRGKTDEFVDLMAEAAGAPPGDPARRDILKALSQAARSLMNELDELNRYVQHMYPQLAVWQDDFLQEVLGYRRSRSLLISRLETSVESANDLDGELLSHFLSTAQVNQVAIHKAVDDYAAFLREQYSFVESLKSD